MIYCPARTVPRGLSRADCPARTARGTKPIEIALDMALPRIKTYLTGN